MGEWRTLEDVALADCALEIEGRDLADVLATAAAALAALMVDPATVTRVVAREVALEAPRADRLLFDWLAELIYWKDRDGVVFPDAEVRVSGAGPFRLEARLRGGAIDPPRTHLRADPKAPTFHLLEVAPRGDGWQARVVIDI